MIYSLSLSAAGATSSAPVNTSPIPGVNNGVIYLPMKTEMWRIGVSLMLNFTTSGVGIGLTPAVATVNVQICNDPAIQTSSFSTARWNNHDVLTGNTTDANSSIVYPCYAVRMYATSYTSGTVLLMVGVIDFQSS